MTTILAVDDSATMRTCLEITFAGTDLRVVCCEGAAALLDELAAETPALVLVDSSLPPSSGYDLCAAIRASAPEVPILLLTSRHHPFDATRAEVADDHLDKPFDPQELYERAKALIASGPSATSESAPDLEFADAELDEPLPGFDDGEPGLAGLLEPDAPAITMSAPAAPAFVPPAPQAIEPAFEMPSPIESDSDARPRGVTAAWEVPDELRAYRAAAVGFDPAKEAAREVTASWDMSSGVPVAVTPAAVTPAAVTPAAVTPAAVTPAAAIANVPYAASAVTSDASAPAVAAALEAEHVGFSERLEGLGLSEAQIQAVVAMSREVIERVAWEVVPTLAETIIKEELRRLTQA